MSAFAGIFNRDGAPVDRNLLDEFGRRLVYYGLDGGGHKQTASAGMVFRAYHTDRESKLDRQPLVSAAGHILAWDGRLDNRAELISQLPNHVDQSSTDVEIGMASRLRWGTEFLTHLIGDFALSLWEPDSRTLLLARDAFGTRPLYYQLNSQRIIWSSHLSSLLDVSTLQIEVKRKYIASYLSGALDLYCV